MFYERHPESMRTVVGVFPAGRDSIPADPAEVAIYFFGLDFSENFRPPQNFLRGLQIDGFGSKTRPGRNFRILGIFNLPQHSLMLRSGHLRNPGFPFFAGRRDPSSAL